MPSTEGLPRWLRILLSALLAGIITAGSSFLAAIAEMGPDATFDEMGQMTIASIVIGAILQVAKDISTYLAEPPRAN